MNTTIVEDDSTLPTSESSSSSSSILDMEYINIQQKYYRIRKALLFMCSRDSKCCNKFFINKYVLVSICLFFFHSFCCFFHCFCCFLSLFLFFVILLLKYNFLHCRMRICSIIFSTVL